MKKFIFSKVDSLESATLLKLNFIIGILHGFYSKFYLATFRIAIFKNTFFPEYLHCFLSTNFLSMTNI